MSVPTPVPDEGVPTPTPPLLDTPAASGAQDVLVPVSASDTLGHLTPLKANPAPMTNADLGDVGLPAFIQAMTSSLDTWLGVNLDEKRPTLDQQGFDIADQQESSMRARKGLAETTKAFKKTPPEEKPKQFGPLLKAYQQEIDRLTKRAKAAESSFLSLYKSLYDAPDPAPLLRRALGYTKQLDTVLPEKAKLEQDLKDLKEDLGEIKNQEVTVRELENALAVVQAELEHARAGQEDTVRQQVEAKLESMMQSQRELVAEYVETEKALTAQLKDAQDALVVVQERNDAYQAQLLDLKSQHDEQQEALTHETDMLASDLDAANAKVATLERELAERVNSNATTEGGPVGLDPSVTLAAEELSQLRVELQSRDKALQRTEDHVTELETQLIGYEQRVTSLEAELATERDNHATQVRSLEAALEARPSDADVARLAKQIQSFKALQFNFLSADDDASEHVPDLERMLNENSLEALLTTKNQKLESEVTSLRVNLGYKTEELTTTKSALEKANAELKASCDLVARLEADLADSEVRCTDSVPLAPGAAATTTTISGTPTGVPPPTEGDLAPDPFRSAQAQVTPTGDDSRFAIVCEQRDRFRRRVTTLEEEAGRLREERKKISHEVASLRSDNISLYEKIRYLENYRNKINTGIGPDGARESDRLLEDGAGSAEERYGDIYEEKMNPFNEFNRREKERRYENLNAAERLTLTGSRFFLSNKYSRMFLFGYSLFLHLMVFFVLYRYTHDTHDCYHASKDHID